MNRAALIEAVENELSLRKKAPTVDDVLGATINVIIRAVAEGDHVTITGFGVFRQRARAARMGRNPRTGTMVPIKPTTVPDFCAGTAFRRYVAEPDMLPTGSVGGRRPIGNALVPSSKTGALGQLRDAMAKVAVG